MLAPELQNYLDSLKPKANTISDEQLRGMLKVAGYGEEVFAEAIDYFRSPSAPASKTPAPDISPVKKIVMPKSVVTEMRREATTLKGEATMERRPNVVQWTFLVVLGVTVSCGALSALARTMPTLFAGTQEFSKALAESDAAVALAPGLLIALAGLLIMVFLARHAYRKKGRVVTSFLFGLSIGFVFFTAAYAGVQTAITFFGGSLPQHGFAISLALSFARELYATVFFGGFVLGAFLLFLSYMFSIPLQESFQESAGGQVRVIMLAFLLAAYLFNIAYFPALVWERTELCHLIFDTSLKSNCFMELETLERVRRAVPAPLPPSEDDQYLRDIQAF